MSLQKNLPRQLICFVATLMLLMTASVCNAQNDPSDKKEESSATAAGAKEIKTLQGLIRELERNESLYANQKLELTRLYEEFPRHSDPEQQIRKQWDYSLLLQGEKFHLEEKSKGRLNNAYIGGRPKQKSLTTSTFSESESIQVFDGTTHRSLWLSQRETGNPEEPRLVKKSGRISHEYPSLTNYARPHMYFLSSGAPKVPLSTYLKGIEAVLACPNPSYVSPGSKIKVQLFDDEEFQGLKCKRLLIDVILSSGIRHNGWELWLARDRNLIPVRNISYTYRWSEEIPVAESTVDEWQEIRHGVWIPVRFHTDRYNSFIIKREGKQQLKWRKQEHVKSIKLDPQDLPQDVFTKLDFPQGTKVSGNDLDNDPDGKAGDADN